MSYSTEQCFFCTETDSLIHMDINSLIIESVYIDFAQLISDLMQIKIGVDSDNNMICVSCKDHLSNFYIMKQRASKHLKPSEIRKMQIIDTVSEFLDSTQIDCIVSKYPKMLAIHPDTNNSTFVEQLQSCTYFLDSEIVQYDDNEIIEYTIPTQISEVKVEDISHFESETYDEAQFEITTGDEIIDTPISIETDAKITFTSPNAEKFEELTINRRPKKYQKSTLDSRQREWLRNSLKECAVHIHTSFGVKTQWRCNKCQLKTFSSENAFRIHLKAHLENSDASQFIDDQEPSGWIKKSLNPDDKYHIEQKLWIQQQIQCQKETIETNEGQNTIWTCSQCEYSSNKRGRFRVHLQKAHTNILMRGPNKHSCFDCRLRFDGENHLLVHKNCHRIFDVIAPYAIYPECVSCKMFFCTADDCQIHINRHKENPEALQEMIPAMGVVHRNGEHFISAEETPEVFDDENCSTCGHCLRRFSSETDCKHHLMLYHATAFSCPFDARVFDGIPTLSFGNHLRQCHPDIFPELEIACSFCKMQFETVYEKLAHMKVCTSKMFQCDHCDRSFFRKAELLHHLKVVYGLTVFACHFCAKRCKDQGDLKTHIRSHTNDRPYKCPHCDKAYKTSSARASHVESHMDQTHICNVCNVKFRRRILYQRHMKLLHDAAYREKAFSENTCHICSKSYLRKTHFKNHMKTHKVD